MIEIWLEPLTAKGLTPGQPVKIYMTDGSIWILTRFGAECISKCLDDGKEKK
jgi:hypothetical protein